MERGLGGRVAWNEGWEDGWHGTRVGRKEHGMRVGEDATTRESHHCLDNTWLS